MAQVLVVTSGKGRRGQDHLIRLSLALRWRSPVNTVVMVDFDVGLRNLDLIMGAERRVVFDLINVIQGHAKLRRR